MLLMYDTKQLETEVKLLLQNLISCELEQISAKMMLTHMRKSMTEVFTCNPRTLNS